MLEEILRLTPALVRTPLRAGPLSLAYEAGDLRYIRLGTFEIARRIYAAVRDHNWNTIPGVVHSEQIESNEDSFRISYRSIHQQGGIHFEWDALITGSATGEIQFQFNGEAKSIFLKNRIGLCVLHPSEFANSECVIRHSTGEQATAIFPRLVAAPQPVPGFNDVQGMIHPIAPGVRAELDFSGDIFETEDQRNWIDASFKTFCTPLSLPFPVRIEAGDRITQSILLRLSLDDPRAVPRIEMPDNSNRVTVSLSEQRCSLPKLGVVLRTQDQPPTQRERESLAALELDHLRVDARASESFDAIKSRLEHANSHAIELALHLDAGGDSARNHAFLVSIGRWFETREIRPARILVFGLRSENSTPLAALRAANQELQGLGAPMGVGTVADFCQLNQFRPPVDNAQFVCWAMNPQVHSFDLASMAETPTAILAQLDSARAFFPGRPLVISPVTLKPQFNPVATGPESGYPAGELPPEVDSRQLTPFAAVWTLAVLKHFSEAGASSVTLFETTGWGGVLETEAGSPLPSKFPSKPGQLFPLYHAIVAVTQNKHRKVIPSVSSQTFKVATLVFEADGTDQLIMLAGNLTHEHLRVVPPIGFRVTRLNLLNWTVFDEWMRDPLCFVNSDRPATGHGTDYLLPAMPPFALARFVLSRFP